MILIHIHDILRVWANFYLKKKLLRQTTSNHYSHFGRHFLLAVQSTRAPSAGLLKTSRPAVRQSFTAPYWYSALRDHLHSNWKEVQILRNRRVIPLAWSGNLSIRCSETRHLKGIMKTLTARLRLTAHASRYIYNQSHAVRRLQVQKFGEGVVANCWTNVI